MHVHYPGWCFASFALFLGGLRPEDWEYSNFSEETVHDTGHTRTVMERLKWVG